MLKRVSRKKKEKQDNHPFFTFQSFLTHQQAKGRQPEAAKAGPARSCAVISIWILLEKSCVQIHTQDSKLGTMRAKHFFEQQAGSFFREERALGRGPRRQGLTRVSVLRSRLGFRFLLRSLGLNRVVE